MTDIEEYKPAAIDWTRELQELGCYWRHDGNPSRPYALLTSGKISNLYIDCTPLTMRAYLMQKAMIDLVKKRRRLLGDGHQIDAVIAPALGAVSLAVLLGCHYQVPHMFVVKKEFGGKELDRRFPIGSIRKVIVAEDVIMTGNSLLDTIAACSHAAGRKMLPQYAYTIVNRSNHKYLNGFHIISLVDINASEVQTWEDGHNPFTPDGKERVEPLKPKDKSNWKLLTKEY
ncbi:MAG: orotate phosphoribosyltransferase [Candidatus Adlerbacteria bacterium]|nr:orotate phosphoribosyltransferase [Candidatus Adlerbacteria bacterium]